MPPSPSRACTRSLSLQALALSQAVCGPLHRATALALELLAKALFHLGDLEGTTEGGGGVGKGIAEERGVREKPPEKTSARRHAAPFCLLFVPVLRVFRVKGK